MTSIDGLSLTEAEHKLEKAHPGWHIWHSQDGNGLGREYAANTSTAAGGTGSTVDAPCVERIEEAIGQWEWQYGRPKGQAA